VLAFAVLLIVPFNAYRSLLNERDQETFELLSITALKPRQIVWGKLLSASIQLFLYYSAITPFIAFCSLIQGFDTVMAGYMLIMTMFLSLLLSMVGLMISTGGKTRSAQGFLTFSTLSLLILTLYTVYALVVSRRVFSSRISFNDPTTWWVTLCVFFAGTSYFFFSQQITVNQLTFESDNRSSGIRLIFSLQFWMLWGGILGYYHWSASTPTVSPFYIFVIVSILHLAIGGLFLTTEGDFLSHRIRRSIPQRSIFRLIRFPFMPGGSLGYFFILVHLLALGIFVVLLYLHAFQTGVSISTIGSNLSPDSREYYLSNLWNMQSRSWTPEIRFTVGAILYVVIILGFATFLARWGSSVSVEIKPNHARILTIMLVTAGVIFPLVVESLQSPKRAFSYSLVEVISPYPTLEYLATSGWKSNQVQFDWQHPRDTFEKIVKFRGYSEFILLILFMTAALAIFANLKAMIRSVGDVLHSPSSSQ